jgi:hypothetical protein
VLRDSLHQSVCVILLSIRMLGKLGIPLNGIGALSHNHALPVAKDATGLKSERSIQQLHDNSGFRIEPLRHRALFKVLPRTSSD